jgi:hypothetical protein
MIAAGAVSAGLGPSVALAADGYVTIAQKDNKQEPYTYDAFQIVTGDVVKAGDEYKGTHLNWVNNTVMTNVMSFLETYDGSDAGTTADYKEFLATKYDDSWEHLTNSQRQLAQNVVEFIAAEIDASANDTTANTTPATKQGDSFAAQLSRHLYAAGMIPDDSVTQGVQKTLDQGYWLITSTPTAVANGEAGSAPMWVPVSATPLTITEKTAVPTINKFVKDDSEQTNDFAKIADAGAGEVENLDFRIASTLPQNIDAFASYKAVVADALPAGMSFKNGDASSVQVLLAGVDITNNIAGENGSIVVNGKNLIVTINNVKDAAHLSDADVLSDKNLVVNYKAHLDGTANIGTTLGNVNTATLTYDADPNNANLTKSIESTANVITYSVTLNKVDKVTRLPLKNAKFTCKQNIGSTDYFVKQDGTLTSVESEAYKFTTDDSGQLVIPRLDEGTYTLHETDAPANYELEDSDITLTIDATKDGAAGTLTALSASVTGGEGFTDGTVTLASGNNGILGTDTTEGSVNFITSDDLIIKLPVTGLPVKTAVLVGGVIIAGASIAVMVAKKRSQKEE